MTSRISDPLHEKTLGMSSSLLGPTTRHTDGSKAPAFQMFPRSDGAPDGSCGKNGDFVEIFETIFLQYLGVSKNRGTPKSSILIGFSIINHPFWGTTWYHYFWKHPFHLGANYGQLQWIEPKKPSNNPEPMKGIGWGYPRPTNSGK